MNPHKKNFVSQLIFSEDAKEVATLLKLKGPRKLIGKLTGQGGSVEDGETALEAAKRETLEESGLTATNWAQIGYVEYDDCTVTFYAATADLSQAQTKEAEPIIVLDVDTLKQVAQINPSLVAEDLIPLIETYEALRKNLLVSSSAHDSSHFANLLAGVRNAQPKCSCGTPLMDDVRIRHTEAGKPERICRWCHTNELADELQKSSSAGRCA